ncbi:MAG: DUF4147 domain-containing protein [Chloroflexota bacterium]
MSNNSPKFENYRQHVDQIIAAAVAAVNPYSIVAQAITIDESGAVLVNGNRYPSGNGKLYVVAIGKAAVPMATAAVDQVGAYIAGGVAVTKIGQTETVGHPRFKTYLAAHPVPDQSSIDAAEAVFELLDKTGPNDLVLFLISGGASALCTRPLIPLEDWQTLSQALLASGCTIQAFNTVRKQLDEVKGGGLALAAHPAQQETLILSDVVGSPVDMIGSGPTVYNPQTAKDALQVLERYDIEVHSAAAQLKVLYEKQVNISPFSVSYAVQGDIGVAARAAIHQAAGLGFNALLLSTGVEGEAREIGRYAAQTALLADPGSAVILGGETTVTLPAEHGLGGRNQEIALAAALQIAGAPNLIVATYATDGDDGPTPAAGATVHGETVAQARAKGLDPAEALTRSNSHTFFKALGNHLIQTGQTGTNVNDLIIILKY